MIRSPIGGRLQDVLDAVAQLQNAGELVTLQRVASQLNLPRQNIWRYVRQLQTMGLIVYQPTERYTSPMHLSEAGWLASRVPVSSQADLRLPILGEIAAGQPILAAEQLEAHVTRLQDVLNIHAGDFLLRVRGDSMVGIGIYPGDLVAIHPQAEEPLSGEIVLVLVPGEGTATLKRWHRNNGTVTLTSENPAFAPMTFPAAEVMVQGCMVGHIGTGRSRRSPSRESP